MRLSDVVSAGRRRRWHIAALVALLGAAVLVLLPTREDRGVETSVQSFIAEMEGIVASSTFDVGDGGVQDRLARTDVAVVAEVVDVVDAGAPPALRTDEEIGPIGFIELELSVLEVLGGRRAPPPNRIRIQVPRPPTTNVERVTEAMPFGTRVVVFAMATDAGPDTFAYTDASGLLFEDSASAELLTLEGEPGRDAIGAATVSDVRADSATT